MTDPKPADVAGMTNEEAARLLQGLADITHSRYGIACEMGAAALRAAPPATGAGEMREEITSLIGEGVHACLRKYCESTAASQAYHAIQEMDDAEWAGVCEEVADALLSHLNRPLPAPEVPDKSFSDRLLNSNIDPLECERLGGEE